MHDLASSDQHLLYGLPGLDELCTSCQPSHECLTHADAAWMPLGEFSEDLVSVLYVSVDAQIVRKPDHNITVIRQASIRVVSQDRRFGSIACAHCLDTGGGESLTA
ncbi:hypothetical protein BJH93_08945 [Kocuria polaris]|nr:hypothetical protein [Kocuria polaris]